MEQDSVVFYWDSMNLSLIQILEWNQFEKESKHYVTSFKYLTGVRKGEYDAVDDVNPEPFKEVFFAYRVDVLEYFKIPEHIEQKGLQRAVRGKFDLGEIVYYKTDDNISFGKISVIEIKFEDDRVTFENGDSVLLSNCFKTIDDLFVALLV